MRREFHIKAADWVRNREALRYVRETVFVQEQNVPLEMEWDEDDADSVHLLAVDENGQPVGTGRLTQDARIGRMAVLKSWRNCGVGAALLRGLMDAARARGDEQITLHAQVSAIPFYQRHGYELLGTQFMEAGIPHQNMRTFLQ